MAIERVQKRKVKGLNEITRIVRHTENNRGVAHAVHHIIGLLFPPRCISLRVQKVIPHKCTIFFGEVPTIVHGGAQ